MRDADHHPPASRPAGSKYLHEQRLCRTRPRRALLPLHRAALHVGRGSRRPRLRSHGARRSCQRGREYRMEQGFCLPVHGLNGFDGWHLLPTVAKVDVSPADEARHPPDGATNASNGDGRSPSPAPRSICRSPRGSARFSLHSALGLSALANRVRRPRLAITERTVDRARSERMPETRGCKQNSSCRKSRSVAVQFTSDLLTSYQ